MKPRERRETGQNDLFKAKLDQIIDMRHPRVRLARRIDWGIIEKAFGAVYADGPGRPPLPTRLMAGLHILKYSENLSDERLCEVWAGNPHYPYFCGEEFFQHQLVFDRSSLTRWRQRMGEEKLNALIQESLAVAVKSKALKPSARGEFQIGKHGRVSICLRCKARNFPRFHPQTCDSKSPLNIENYAR